VSATSERTTQDHDYALNAMPTWLFNIGRAADYGV